jgi:ribosomal protein L29
MLDSEGPVCDVVDPSALPPEEWKRLYEREHARAEAAEARITELEGALGESEARAEEWKLESIRARGELNGLRGIFESNREKLAAARAELKELGRSQSARNLRKLEKKLARLQGLLNAAGIDSGPHTIVGMRKEISRLKAVIAERRANWRWGSRCKSGRKERLATTSTASRARAPARVHVKRR